MPSQIEAVIFDLDGTLVDSMWLWDEIDIEFLGRYGQERPPHLEREIEGMNFTETARYFKSRFSIPLGIEAIKEEWNRMAYHKYALEVSLKPGADRFLRLLREKNILTAIASCNSRELLAACLRHNRVSDQFDFLITSSEVERGKPAPDLYLQAAGGLGVRPESCLVFEDVPNGIRAGKNAGMRVCAVEDSYSSACRKEIRELADYYIHSYKEAAEGRYEVLA